MRGFVLLQTEPVAGDPGIGTDWLPGLILVVFVVCVWGWWSHRKKRERKSAS